MDTMKKGTYVKMDYTVYCAVHKRRNGIEVVARYDCKTVFGGSWAYLCPECFNLYGCGLGTGVGQELIYEH